MSHSLMRRASDSETSGQIGKYRASQPGDSLELEADRVAEEVLRMPDVGAGVVSSGGSGIQRKCIACQQGGAPCPACSMSMAPAAVSRGQRQSQHTSIEEGIQRQPLEQEEMQLKLKPQSGPGATTSNSGSLSVIEAVRGGGVPLPEAARAYFEPRFGINLGDVRVHTGETAAQATSAVNARAFTLGNSIAFAPGQFDPAQLSGRRLLAHELTHVVQQSVDVGRSPKPGRSNYLYAAPAPAPAPAPAAPAAAPAGPAVALVACTGKNSADAGKAETRMGDWLKTALTSLDNYVKAPADAAHAPVAAALNVHFHRVDADGGTAVADRLRRVQGAVGGGIGGQCADAKHPSCQAGADGFASTKARTVGLCPLFFTEPIETQANTLLHEGMHLHGAKHHIPDRAYSHARQYAILTPEEAFDNADSFSNLVQDLVLGPGSSQLGAAAPPVDTYRGCDAAQKEKLGRGLGFVQKWVDPAFNAVTQPNLSSQALVQTEVVRFLGDATAATLQKASLAYARVGTVLVKSMPLVCEAAGANCPKGTAGYFGPGKPGLHLCPEWFSLGTDELRGQFLFDFLLQQQSKLHAVDSPDYVSLAKALLGITFAAPPAIPARAAPAAPAGGAGAAPGGGP